MDEERAKPTVYFDGSCPLCRAEIGYYRGKTEDDVLRFVDVSKIGVETPEGLTRQQALERFHVLTSDGRVLSGAAAFVEVWSQVPGWRWVARAASLPPVLAVLELGYRMFLPIRPVISRLVKRVIMAKSAGNRA